MFHGLHTKVRGQVAGFSSVFPSFAFSVLKSDFWARWQMLY